MSATSTNDRAMSGQRYSPMKSRSEPSEVLEHAAEGPDQHQAHDRADHVGRRKAPHVMPAAPANRHTGLLGAMATTSEPGLVEPPLELAQQLAVGRRLALHPADRAVAVPAADQEEEQVGGEQPQEPDQVEGPASSSPEASARLRFEALSPMSAAGAR